MAGTPAEQPERFVCMNCYTVAAGLPEGDDPDPQDYTPPSQCGACGEADFVDFNRFQREYKQRT